MDYKSLYEREQLEKLDLLEKLSEIEIDNEDLKWRLKLLVESRSWRITKPLRRIKNKGKKFIEKLQKCKNLEDIINVLLEKRLEDKAKQLYGRQSFPSKEASIFQRNEKFSNMVKISVLVPLYNTPKTFLVDMLDSIMNQTYSNWELCLADGSDINHNYVKKICEDYVLKSGGRVIYKRLKENNGISGNTNECLKLASGEYIGLLDHDDILHPSVLYEYVKVINEKNADFIYCDELTFIKDNIDKVYSFHFKPDYAPDNLRANNYICHFSVFSRQLLDSEELFRSKFDGSQDHDMILRLTNKAKNIVHIPKILYYWRSHSGSVASGIEAKYYAVDAAKRAIGEYLKQLGFEGFRISSTRAFPTIFNVQYAIKENPLVSIVIHSNDNYSGLKRCIDSICEKTTYSNYEIVIIDNNSKSSEIRKYYKKIRNANIDDELNVNNDKLSYSHSDLKETLLPNIRIINQNEHCNVSSAINTGVRNAKGKYVVLLNNFTKVISPNWIEQLLMYAQRDDVGAVGAKLYFEDLTIRSAGIIIGIGTHRVFGHGHFKQNIKNIGYMGRLCYAQDCSAVSGACLMVKKSLFFEVGELDDSFSHFMYDVDFCLKLRQKGLLNIFTPFAELYYYETNNSVSKEKKRIAKYRKEADLFKLKWHNVLLNGDPYYNPNLSLDKSDFSIRISKYKA